VDGWFTGSAQATFYVSPEVSFSSSDSIIGIATESGRIRMRFTSDSDGGTIIGVGQFREVNGTSARYHFRPPSGSVRPARIRQIRDIDLEFDACHRRGRRCGPNHLLDRSAQPQPGEPAARLQAEAPTAWIKAAPGVVPERLAP
jgi:hypothetical protein